VRYGLVSGLTTATSGTAIDYNATALDGKWDLASGTRIINIQMDATIASALNADGYGIAVFYQKGSNGTTIPTYADATTDFDIEPNTASAADDENLGAAGDTDGTKTVNVSAAAAAASIALGANSVVGAAGDTTLTITTPIDLANADTIAFTMPDNLDVGSVALSTTTFTYAGSVGFVCATSSQVITCTADGAITAASANIVMSGITSKYATTSQTISSIAVYDTTASANIATGSSGTVTDTTDADAVASIGLGANSVVGTAGDTTLTITIPVNLANTDTIVFTMPDNLDISSVALSTTTFTYGGSVGFACTDSSQVITCTADGAITAKAGGTIAMTGITSKYATTSQTISSIVITDVAVSGESVATDASGSVTDTTVADAAASIGLADGKVGATQNTTLTITTPVDLADTDTIVLTMSDNLDLTSLATTTTDDFEGAGGFACVASSQVITCTADGAITAKAGGTITMTGITARYATTTVTISSVVITDVAVSGESVATDDSGSVTDTTLATTFTTTVDASAIAVVGSTGNLVLSGTTMPVALATSDTIKITFPANFNISGAGNATTDFTGTPGLTKSVSGQVLTLTADAAIPAESGKAITIAGITSKYATTSQNVAILIEKSTGQDVVGASANTGVDKSITDTTLATTFTTTVDASAIAVVGSTGNLVLSGTTMPVALATSDTIKITFPANFNISGAGNATTDFTGTPGLTKSVSGQVLTLTADAAIPAESGKAITISGITSKYATTSQTVAILIEKSTGEDVVGASANTGVSESITDTTDANATASIALGANSVVSTAGDTTLTITIPVDLANTDTIVFTMPDNLDVNSVALSTTTFTYGGSVGFACTDSSQVITCTADGAITAEVGGTIVMSGITSKYATTSQTISSITINDVAVSKESVATDASGAVTDTTAITTLTSAFSASAVTIVGDVTGQATSTITFPVALATDDTIKITFPDNWDISGITTGAGKTYGLDNTVAVGVSSQVLTLTLEGAQGATAETISFETDKITPKYAATGTVAILIEKAGGEDVVAASTNTGVSKAIDETTAADPESSIDVSAIATVGTAGNVVVTFDVDYAMADNDELRITFPANFDVSGATYGSDTFTGSFDACSASGQIVTCTATSTFAKEDAGTVTITGIEAGYVAAASTYTTTLYDTSASANIATASNDVIALTSAASLTQINVGANPLTANTASVYTVTFKTINALTSGQKIQLDFGTGFTIADSTSTAKVTTLTDDGTDISSGISLSSVASTKIIKITLNSSVAASSIINIVLDSTLVTNPSTASATIAVSGIDIYTTDSSGNTIDQVLNQTAFNRVIDLVTGWNIFAPSQALENSAVSTVLAPIGTSTYSAIYTLTWSAVTETMTWQTATVIEPLGGYAINISGAAQKLPLDFAKEEASNATFEKNLTHEGWQSIGYTGDSASLVAQTYNLDGLTTGGNEEFSRIVDMTGTTAGSDPSSHAINSSTVSELAGATSTMKFAKDYGYLVFTTVDNLVLGGVRDQ